MYKYKCVCIYLRVFLVSELITGKWTDFFMFYQEKSIKNVKNIL